VMFFVGLQHVLLEVGEQCANLGYITSFSM
jgi:hypothetical protein